MAERISSLHRRPTDRERQPLYHRHGLRESGMSGTGTLCIAAKCLIDGKEPSIVLCTDKRFENEVTSTEVGFKFDKIQHEKWVCVFSGTVQKARTLAAKYRDMLGGTTLTTGNFLHLLAEPARAQRYIYTDDFVRARHSISYADFLSGKDQFSASTFRDTEQQIVEVNLGCSLIIAGAVEDVLLDDKDEECPVFNPVMCATDDWGRIDIHDHFAAIGSGAQSAEAMLHYRGQHKGMSLARTIYHVYEAKSFAESAAGVGTLTDLAWIDSSYLYWRFMNDAGLQYLKYVLDRHAPKPTTDIVEQAVPYPYACSWHDREQMHEL